jgi:hypothetical protein
VSGVRRPEALERGGRVSGSDLAHERRTPAERRTRWRVELRSVAIPRQQDDRARRRRLGRALGRRAQRDLLAQQVEAVPAERERREHRRERQRGLEALVSREDGERADHEEPEALVGVQRPRIAQ